MENDVSFLVEDGFSEVSEGYVAEEDDFGQEIFAVRVLVEVFSQAF